MAKKEVILWEDATQKEKIARVEHLLKIMTDMTPHERKKHFDMSDWGQHTPCGTVACLAGHAAMRPWFRKRGFSGQVLFDEDDYNNSLAEWKADNSIGDKPNKNDPEFWGEFIFDEAEPEEFFGYKVQGIFCHAEATFGETKVRVEQVLKQLKQGVEL